MRNTRFFFLGFVFVILYMLPMLPTSWEPYSIIRSFCKYCALFFSSLALVESLRYYSRRQQLFICLAYAIVFIVGFNNGLIIYLYMLFSIIIGAKDINYAKILKLWLLICTIFCLFNVIGTLAGIIHETMVDIGSRDIIFENTTNRRDFGYGWATDFALHVMFLLLVYWITKNGYMNIWENMAFVLIGYFVTIYTDARLATGGIMMILLCEIYLVYLRKKKKVFMKFSWFLIIFWIPLLAFSSLVMVVAYNPTNIWWVALDIIMSRRLTISQSTLEDTGIPLFGQKYQFYGMTQTQNESGIDDLYNYIDCAYVQNFVINGIIVTCLYLLFFVYICRDLYRRKDMVLSMAIVIAGISGLFSQYIFHLSYCPLLLALTTKHK